MYNRQVRTITVSHKKTWVRVPNDKFKSVRAGRLPKVYNSSFIEVNKIEKGT